MMNSEPEKVKSCILDIISRPGARVHFVGILGAGMLPLARLLAHRGITVSGTDRSDTADRTFLEGQGIAFTPRHTSDGMDGVELVVYSLAIPHDSPELLYAKGQGIPTVTRAELLGAVASGFGSSVAVAGTHGKSTTVAILAHILSTAHLSPTVVSGATLTTGDALLVGDSDIFVAEACEYRNAYHSLSPYIALITNIDLDHVDFFPDIEAVRSSFLTFGKRAERVLLNMSCGNSARLLATLGDRAITYGTPDADYPLLYYSIGSNRSEFLMRLDGAVFSFTLFVCGWGALIDAVGAIAAAHLLGVPVSSISAAVADFSGIERRIEPLGRIGSTHVYYDYAHHPREIKNTLDVLMRRHGSVSVIFRPHTYSRTAALMDDFCDALSVADCVAVLDSYAARESEIVGGRASDLVLRLGSGAGLVTRETAVPYALSHGSGALALMGAGEVDGVLFELKKRIKNQ